uniref:DIS3-like exonuclease 2 n=1 Tax=Myxine glutinosa TaxID=7769 RepID=UPI00358F45D3
MESSEASKVETITDGGARLQVPVKEWRQNDEEGKQTEGRGRKKAHRCRKHRRGTPKVAETVSKVPTSDKQFMEEAFLGEGKDVHVVQHLNKQRCHNKVEASFTRTNDSPPGRNLDFGPSTTPILNEVRNLVEALSEVVIQAAPQDGPQHRISEPGSSTDRSAVDHWEKGQMQNVISPGLQSRMTSEHSALQHVNIRSQPRPKSPKAVVNNRNSKIDADPSSHKQHHKHRQSLLDQVGVDESCLKVHQPHELCNSGGKQAQTARNDVGSLIGGGRPHCTPSSRKKRDRASPQMHSPGSPRNTAHKGRHAVYEDYLSSLEVSAGLKRGELLQGAIRINKKNFREAYVPNPTGATDILIDGVEKRNRALDGDIVVVKLIPHHENEEYRAQEGNVCVENGELANEYDGDISTSDLDKTKVDTLESDSNVAPKSKYKLGKVVFIVERKHSRAAKGYLRLPQNYCRTAVQSGNKKSSSLSYALFAPTEHRMPRMRIPLSRCPAEFLQQLREFEQTLFVARIIDWPRHSRLPEGQLSKSLGFAGEIEPETEGILMEYDVDYSEFPEEVLHCLPRAQPWSIPAAEIAARKDLRKLCIFSIDPVTARDLDDALSCEPLPDGNFCVGVHIADVSYFLPEDTALDAIAAKRATSVYLVQKVIPMLPRLLCEELCSLNPGKERLTFSVMWTLTPDGKVKDEWFGRTVIRSCAKLSYDQAQDIIISAEKGERNTVHNPLPPLDGDHDVQTICRAVLNLHSIATHLRHQRFEDGALRIDNMKLVFHLDQETMLPESCFASVYKESNKLVEEFMLLANMAVAHRIYKAFPQYTLLRRHPPPQEHLLAGVQDFCQDLGLVLDCTSAGALHHSLHNTFGSDEDSQAKKYILMQLCARPMKLALYFCTGALRNEEEFRHYALNIPLYTHFTSPIRRYPDVIVHRLLAKTLGYDDRVSLDVRNMQVLAEHCNDRKRASKRVQELSAELFFNVFVQEKGPLESRAVVMVVQDKSFDVYLLRFGIQKRVYCNNLPLKDYHYSDRGSRSTITLMWEPEDAGDQPIKQIIKIFVILETILTASEDPQKHTVVVTRPKRSEPMVAPGPSSSSL